MRTNDGSGRGNIATSGGAGTLILVTYTDPWGISTPATSQTGVVATTGGTPPSNTVLAACLVEGTTPIAYGTARMTTDTAVVVMPAAPLSAELSYQIWLQWITPPKKAEDAVWPTTDMLAAPLVVSVPSITSAALAGTKLSATWAFGSGAGGNSGANLEVFDPVAGTSAGYVFGQGSSGANDTSIAPGAKYVAYIQAVQPAMAQPGGGFAGPYSFGPYAAPIPLTADAPAIQSLDLDGTTLAVQWDPVALDPSLVAAEVAYTLTLLDVATPILTVPATATGAIVTLDAPLRSRMLSAVGAVRVGPVRGPLGAPQPIITQAPSITGAAVSQDGRSVLVALIAPAGLTSSAAITVELVQDGVTVVGSAPATGTPLSATLRARFTAGHAYTLRAYAKVAATTTTPAIVGPRSNLVSLIVEQVAAPVVAYDGTAINVSWTALQNAALTAYEVTFAAPAPTVVTTSETSISIPTVLAPGTNTKTVISTVTGVGKGQQSDTTHYVTPVPTTPVIVSCTFDGRQVALAWTPSSGPGVDGYVVTGTGTSDQNVGDLSLSFRAGLSPWLTVPLPADPTPRTWTFVVSPTLRDYTGTASAPATAFTAIPVISNVSVVEANNALNASVNWSLANSTTALLAAMRATGATVQLVVLDGDEPIAVQSVAVGAGSGTATVPIPSAHSTRLTVAGQTEGTGAAGPRGGRVALLTMQPSRVVGSYDGTLISLDWMTIGDGITGHYVMLTPSAGSVITIVTGSAPGLVLPTLLDLGATWKATVQPFGTDTVGLASEGFSIAMPTVTVPLVTTIRYDDGVLALSWSVASPLATYVVTVLQNGVAIATQNAGPALATTVPVDVTPTDVYTATVQPIIGRMPATASAPVTLNLAIPTPLTCTTDAVSGLSTLTWSALAGATSYRVRLAVNGELSGPETDIAGTSTTLSLAGMSGAIVGAALAAVSTAGGTTSVGPFHTLIPLPTSAPALLDAAFDGTLLSASWSAVTGASGYQLSVLQTGATKAFFSIPVAAPATSAVINPAIAGGTYSVVVQALFGGSGSVVSAPLNVVLTAPLLATPTFDGKTLSMTVTAPANVTPTGYDVTLLRNGLPVQRYSASAPATNAPLMVPITSPIDASATYTLDVRARVGMSAGPSVTTTVLLASPALLSIVADTQLTVTAGPGLLVPTGLTMDAVLITDGVMGAPQPMPNGRTQFAIPSGTHFVVAVRGTSAGATGPWSVPTTALASAPTALAASFADGRLAVSWSGNAGGSFTVAALTTSVLAEVIARGLSATLSLVATADTAYTVQVAEVLGIAVGPTATLPLVTDGCAVQSAVVYGDRSVRATFTLPSAPATGITLVQPVIVWGDGQLALPAQPATSAPLEFVLPSGVPNGAALALRALTGSAIGPVGAGTPLLTTVPTGLTLSYQDHTITARWNAAPDGMVDGYQAMLIVDDKKPVIVPAPGPVARINYQPPTPNAVATIAVLYTAANGSGPASTAATVIAQAPSITSAVVDDDLLTLEWSALTDANVTSYLVSVLAGGVVTSETTVGGTAATVTVPSGAMSVSVRGVGADSVGPAQPPTAILTSAPVIATAAFDAVSGDCTLTWPAVAGAATYQVRLVGGLGAFTDTVAQVRGTVSYTIGKARFTTAGTYTFTVSAMVSATITGPWSAPIALTAIAPLDVTLSYDGAHALVSWTGVPSPLVTGYQLSTVVSGAAALFGQTTGTSGRFHLTATAGTSPTVVVQAVAGGITGAPSAAVPLFTPALFLSASTTQAPYVAPSVSPSMTAADIVLYLPNIFLTKPDDTKLPATAPFVVAPVSGDTTFFYTLTIGAASAAWTFGADKATVRADLLAAYKTFLSALETLTATPIGIRTVQDAIARAMPQTFAETLYYSYGLAADLGYVDLKPGMILRAEYESYQYPGPSVTDGGILAGFVTSAVADYEVMSYVNDTAWLTGLDAFLARVAAAATPPAAVTVPAMPADSKGKAEGGGGVIDAFFGQFQKPFCRLVYPPAILAQNSKGSPFPYENPMLLACATATDVEAATLVIRNGALPAGTTTAWFYFRGRATLSAMIRIVVNGSPHLVPVGTTVGNVLASFAARPQLTGIAPQGTTNTGLPLHGIALRRQRGGAVTDPSTSATGYTVGAAWDVRLDWAPSTTYSAVSDWLDLPVLHGDELTFGASRA